MLYYIDAATTLEGGRYPELEPKYYRGDLSELVDAATRVVLTLDNWELLEGDSNPPKWIRSRRSLPVPGIGCRIEIEFDEGRDLVRVDITSRLSPRIYDFGQNARNIREFTAALEERL